MSGKLLDSYGKADFSEIPKVIPGLWRTAWIHDIDQEFQTAVAYLKDQGAFV
jgi:hypothetical protein